MVVFLMQRKSNIRGAFALFLICFSTVPTLAARLGQRSFAPLSSSQISSLVSYPDPQKNLDPSNTTSHLAKILIPRSAGTSNSTIVKDYIVSTMVALNWHVEEDSFTDTTPYGIKKFTNIIATKDTAATRRVVLSAHYDSKFFPSYPQNQFVGATDSAAPCAMMLDLAEALNPLLDDRQDRLEDGTEDDEDIADTTLQLVFFDGEEAFKEWTHTDSVYGARHLAEKWSTTYINPHAKRRLLHDPVSTEISTIEHLILLDLLGAPNPSIRSFFPDTGWLFDAMVDAERKLGDNGHFDVDEQTSNHWTSWFRPRTGYESAWSYIEDDHLPFIQQGVNILHVIAEPFPAVWHQLSDDASALDLPTMRRWNLILRVLMSEYLNLCPEDKPRLRSTDELI